jgi:hypothetical protein
MGGPWGYEIQADQEVEYRCCPLCFRAYSDYENTAVVPCWQCRDEVPLSRFGNLHVEEWRNMPDLLGGANDPLLDGFSEDIECQYDDMKECWLAEEVARGMASIADLQRRLAISEGALRMAKEGTQFDPLGMVLISKLEGRVVSTRDALTVANDSVRGSMRRLARHGSDIDVMHRRDMRWYRREGYGE